MRFHEFFHLTHDFDRLWDFLCDKKVVRSEVICPRCQHSLRLVTSAENHIFHCRNSYFKFQNRKRKRMVCNFKISALHGTWFQGARLSLPKICQFIAYFLMMPPPRQAFLTNELEINDHTVVDWTNFCRELLQQWITNGQNQIGGEGVIVEMDEAKIGKRKYNTGRIIRGQWVFGGIERNTKKFFIVPVPNRSTETLLPIIQKYVKPGSIIHTDKWRAYDILSDKNYTHLSVNHSQNFVDPETGVHTQNIERLWRDMRANIPRYGTRDCHYTHYLAEFVFKKT